MREKINFDRDWKFHRGDLPLTPPAEKGPVYMQAKTERKLYGPASRNYYDNSDGYALNREVNPVKWENVTLPHDYVIAQAPCPDENNALGYFKYENAWYRKTFLLTADDRDKRLCLYFEGVAVHATVYLNGCLLKHNFCGYTSFEVDITDYVDFDAPNVLAVYVNTQEHEGWWYEGGGIYRHVWLEKTAKTAVERWGVYVIPQQQGDSDEWALAVENTIRNDGDADCVAAVQTEIFDGDRVIAQWTQDVAVPLRELRTVRFDGAVRAPHLWDLDDPYQHRAVTTVTVGGAVLDRYETKFGFRTFRLDPDEGLFLNGKWVKIKGVCSHQDFGLTGKAVPDNIFRYRVQLIKEMGANGYRCSHYPHAEATMDTLDEMGFITMAETRWFDSSDEGLAQMEMLIRRDRNRPSVLFWSLGNEEPKHITESGRRICKTMFARARKLDNTRVVMSAVDKSPTQATIYDELDALGVNYNLDKYESLHEKFPDKPIFSSECCATGTTRGWYYDDAPVKGYINAMDKDTNHWFLGRAHTWKYFAAHRWILGGYQWIAFEHRGECMWPRLCSQSGAIDLFLQKKDAFYQNQSLWIDDRPVLHLMPHWNWAGLEGEPIRVRVYTNCQAVTLRLNGQDIGTQQVERYDWAEWTVPYAPGTLTAVGLDADGREVIADTRETTGKAVALRLQLDNPVPAANGADIALFTCTCIDADGREVPDAAPFVRFTTNALGTIVGTGSDVCDHVPVPMPERQMRAGRIAIAVRVGETAGALKLYAESDGLNRAVCTVELRG